MAVVWTFPLVLHLSSSVPGPGASDNVQFLWNFWWMRFALAGGLDPFHTAYLFAPVGVDLTLHTHTALATFTAATLLGTLPLAAAMNLTILTSLALNGFCAYLLAWRVTRDYGASLVAGLIFGGAPMIAGHLNGHFNLTSAWVIPLFALAALDLARGSLKSAFLAGAVLGLTTYVDYYYVVYEIGLAVCLVTVAGSDWSLEMRGPDTNRRWPARLAVVLTLLNLLVIAAIVATGGFTLTIGTHDISMRGLFNPLQVFWLFVAVWLLLRYRPHLTIASPPPWTAIATGLVAMIAAFVVVASPILWRGVALLRSGEYVTQQYFWRSAPTGIDPGTLVLGHPFHGLWGSIVRRVYDALSIDPIESDAWLGIVPMVLAFMMWRRHRIDHSRQFKIWAALGLIFFVWSLGPHLVVFGVNTAMILPQTLLRYVPIVNNARIPGRAIVVTYLALSVIGAMALATWKPAGRRNPSLLIAIALAIVVDFLPAPFSATTLDRPVVYETLRDRPEPGVVLELPLGIHDGFGGRGSIDGRVMYYQTIHQRPILGGYISRLSPAITRTYADDPLINALLDLSEPVPETDRDLSLPDATTAAARLHANNIAFVVVSRKLTSQRLKDYAATLPLTLVAEDDERRLYVVNVGRGFSPGDRRP